MVRSLSVLSRKCRLIVVGACVLGIVASAAPASAIEITGCLFKGAGPAFPKVESQDYTEAQLRSQLIRAQVLSQSAQRDEAINDLTHVIEQRLFKKGFVAPEDADLLLTLSAYDLGRYLAQLTACTDFCPELVLHLRTVGSFQRIKQAQLGGPSPMSTPELKRVSKSSPPKPPLRRAAVKSVGVRREGVRLEPRTPPYSPAYSGSTDEYSDQDVSEPAKKRAAVQSEGQTNADQLVQVRIKTEPPVPATTFADQSISAISLTSQSIRSLTDSSSPRPSPPARTATPPQPPLIHRVYVAAPPVAAASLARSLPTASTNLGASSELTSSTELGLASTDRGVILPAPTVGSDRIYLTKQTDEGLVELLVQQTCLVVFANRTDQARMRMATEKLKHFRALVAMEAHRRYPNGLVTILGNCPLARLRHYSTALESDTTGLRGFICDELKRREQLAPSFATAVKAPALPTVKPTPPAAPKPPSVPLVKMPRVAPVKAPAPAAVKAPSPAVVKAPQKPAERSERLTLPAAFNEEAKRLRSLFEADRSKHWAYSAEPKSAAVALYKCYKDRISMSDFVKALNISKAAMYSWLSGQRRGGGSQQSPASALSSGTALDTPDLQNEPDTPPSESEQDYGSDPSSME